ncbi:hypothetical protein TNCT_239011 [Trichonephila clavata]|uniref:Uncharacterized protein n=1 Tax=Trichonephila clavata TaxID=2740835 RepID=A0A8X6LCI6_TRICU|nr:hypothetical protein TNCT_239011 [Trichonephila clavata]
MREKKCIENILLKSHMNELYSLRWFFQWLSQLHSRKKKIGTMSARLMMYGQANMRVRVKSSLLNCNRSSVGELSRLKGLEAEINALRRDQF